MGVYYGSNTGLQQRRKNKLDRFSILWADYRGEYYFYPDKHF